MVRGADRWKQVERLFYQVLELNSSARPAFLDEACGEDHELRQELESLLESSDCTLTFLQRSVGEVARRAGGEPYLSGVIIGAYRLSKLLGEGGMGEVYLATRADDLYQQEVAIKIMRSGFRQRRATLLRFSTERQVLANLNHPNIARLLDGGITAEGLPYLVMEYVDGVPIDEYCRQHRMPLRARLQLFRSVCAAVEYAHRNLVIHRDIKPQNILVTKDGISKLLDFGIAKLVDPASDDLRLTKTGDRIMTPEYASPEQIRGEAITTATDVYALGVILYELLAERQPFHAGTQSPYELAQAICHQEAVPPSSAVQEISPHARRRPLQKLDRDLDNIVLMAMRKEPARRYKSVDEFAEDLRRYLEGFPVVAREDSWRYRTGKFIRRHRIAALISAAFALSLIVFGISMAVFARRARIEQARAEHVSRFLQSVFDASDPFQAKGATVTARDILDRGTARIQKELKDQPEIQEDVLDTMAQAYQHLGVYDQAEMLFAQEVEAAKRAEGEESPPVARALRLLADVQRQRSKYPEAERSLREAIRLQQKLLPPDDVEFSHTWNNLGLVLQAQGRLNEAEPLFRSAITISRKYPDQATQTLVMMSNLGVLLAQRGTVDEGEALLREVLDRRRQVLGPDHPQVARSLSRLAAVLRNKGSYEEAESLMRESLALNRRVLGEEHIDTLSDMDVLATILQERGDWNGAGALYEKAVDVGTQSLGEHMSLATWMSDLASLRESQGQYAIAEQLYRKALAMTRKLHDLRSVAVARQEKKLAQLLGKRGKYKEAEENFQDALSIERERFGSSHPEMAVSFAGLGELRWRQGQLAAAEDFYHQALAIDRMALPGDHPQTATHLAGLGDVFLEAGDAKSAEPLIREALQIWQNRVGADSWQASATESQLGSVLVARGDRDDAEPLLARSYQTLRQTFGSQAEVTRRAFQRLTQ
jgi:serine/threonine-protein kinase